MLNQAMTFQYDFLPHLLVLYWTGTWWSRVNDEKVKEGKSLIFPGLPRRLSRSRESARNREIEREKERKYRQARGHKLWWNKGALLNSVRVYIPVVSLDKDQETRLCKFTKEARSNRGHKAKRRCLTKEGHKQPLSPKGEANEGNPVQASHLFDL